MPDEKATGFETELRWIVKTLERLEKKIDDYQQVSIARTEVDALFVTRDNQIKDLRNDVDRLETEHIAGLRQDIVDLKTDMRTSAGNKPQWWLVLINATSGLVALIALVVSLVRWR